MDDLCQMASLSIEATGIENAGEFSQVETGSSTQARCSGHQGYSALRNRTASAKSSGNGDSKDIFLPVRG